MVLFVKSIMNFCCVSFQCHYHSPSICFENHILHFIQSLQIVLYIIRFLFAEIRLKSITLKKAQHKVINLSLTQTNILLNLLPQHQEQIYQLDYQENILGHQILLELWMVCGLRETYGKVVLLEILSCFLTFGNLFNKQHIVYASNTFKCHLTLQILLAKYKI